MELYLNCLSKFGGASIFHSSVISAVSFMVSRYSSSERVMFVAGITSKVALAALVLNVLMVAYYKIRNTDEEDIPSARLLPLYLSFFASAVAAVVGLVALLVRQDLVSGLLCILFLPFIKMYIDQEGDEMKFSDFISTFILILSLIVMYRIEST